MKLKIIIILSLVIGLNGCAANGMTAVHRSNIDVLTGLIVKLGIKEEDTPDEARRRVLYAAKLKKALDGLSEYQPALAEQQRKKLEYTLDMAL